MCSMNFSAAAAAGASAKDRIIDGIGKHQRSNACKAYIIEQYQSDSMISTYKYDNDQKCNTHTNNIIDNHQI